MPATGSVQTHSRSVAATKTKVPTVAHPVSTPGYVIIIQFILSCVFNVVVFTLTYSFLVVAISIALLVKAAKKCVVKVRVLSQGARNTQVGNTAEKFWFVAATETRSPSLILLLIVKGRLGIETVRYLVRNRLSMSGEDQDEGHASRLARTPRCIFNDLVWFEDDLDDKVVKEVNLDIMHIFELETRKFTIEEPSSNKDWHINLYTDAQQQIDNEMVFFRFHHCFADLFTLVQFISRNFLDEPTFSFRQEISSTQALCLAFITVLAGPSIFCKYLLKCKDTIFSEPSTENRRALFYSEPVSRTKVETITTATGASAFDVVLSCLAGSLRTCLIQNGVAFPSDINVSLPMNLQSSLSLRCFTSFNILSLPVGTEGAIPRLWEMRLRRNNISSFLQATTMSTAMQLAFLILPNASARRLIQFLLRKSSCTVTCILGQSLGEVSLLDGRPVDSFIPIEDNGFGISITITEYEQKFQLAVLAPTAENWVIKPSQLCTGFTLKLHELSTRLTERARVVRARGQKLLNSRKNSVFVVEEEE